MYVYVQYIAVYIELVLWFTFDWDRRLSLRHTKCNPGENECGHESNFLETKPRLRCFTFTGFQHVLSFSIVYFSFQTVEFEIFEKTVYIGFTRMSLALKFKFSTNDTSTHSFSRSDVIGVTMDVYCVQENSAGTTLNGQSISFP